MFTNELLDFLHVMLLGEEGLDLDQQLLLDHVWHKLSTFGSDCPHLLKLFGKCLIDNNKITLILT